MPGMYQGEDYDLAGFCVGVVEKDAIIDGSRVGAGDAVIGLASSGPHSNGYSLIRKLVALAGATPATQLAGQPLFDQLLTPTRIYVKPLLDADRRTAGARAGAHHRRRSHRQHPAGAAQWPGGGAAAARSWPRQPVFDWLAHTGAIADAEMHRTFNCGIGMVVIVAAERAADAVRVLEQAGEHAMVIGEVRRGERGVVIEA